VEISVLKEENHRYEILMKKTASDAERDISGYRLTIEKLNAELEKCRLDLSEAQKAGSYNQELALELEKERGRLAGLQQTYSSLKEHSARVEAALASRESSVMELSSHADTELARLNRELGMLTERLKEMESLREEDLAVISQLKTQVGGCIN
jgi:chromosome segregation ATPase